MRRLVLPAAVLLLAGCGSEPSGPQEILVEAGAQEVRVPPSQACVDGERQQYARRPPVVEVSPDTTIRITVPDSVAENGWDVQVYDDQIQERLGIVGVETGEAVYEVNSSDVVPAAFYLVVVEDAVDECENFSGAWPVGFLRPGGAQGGTATEPTTPAPLG